MSYQVFLSDDAAYDLEELFSYIEFHDSPASAIYVLDQIEQVVSTLCNNPERGAWPQELRAIGLHEYREVFFKPYRIIYRIIAGTVYVMVITDGRRDMNALLQRRLFQA